MFHETFEFHTDRDTWWKYCILFSRSMHGHEWKLCESEERGNYLAPNDKLQIRIKFVICTKWLFLDTAG